MSKVKLEFKVPEVTTIEHNGVKIEVKPVLLMAEQVFIINAYVKEYFYGEDHSVIDGVDNRCFEAEYVLKNSIFQLSTNLETSEIDANIYVDSALWKKITSQISNYAEFRDRLTYVVNEIKEQNALKLSIGSVVSDLVAKGYEILDKFSKISPEEMKNAIEEGKVLIKQLEESSVLGSNTPELPTEKKN